MPDPLVILDRTKERTVALRDMLAGRPAFLLGGGPSANQLDLTRLQQRGLWSIAVNNMAGHFRSNAFICSDPPSKFFDGIWLDPGMMKFVPIPKLCGRGRGHLRTKVNGEFKPLERDGKILCTEDCPNIWGFARRDWWSYDDTFFTDEQAAWGNGKNGVSRTGNEKVFCTLLLALRLLYYLGARRIFLIGVDFCMDQQGYAFGQGRTDHAISNNNSQYRVVNNGLCKMVANGVFQRAGLEIFNCNQFSGLRAFPYAPFDEAVADALQGFPIHTDLSGWYEKGEKK